MTISISQSGGARVMMSLVMPHTPIQLADMIGVRTLLLDLLDAVLERR